MSLKSAPSGRLKIFPRSRPDCTPQSALGQPWACPASQGQERGVHGLEAFESKEALQEGSDELEMKLERAEKLVNGLDAASGGRARPVREASTDDLEDLLKA